MKSIFSLFIFMVAAGCQQSVNESIGHAEDRFVALDSGGIRVQNGDLACVEDIQSGLMWEVKTNQPGLRAWQNTYSWFNPNENTNELDYRGLANGGQCIHSDCDTWSYTNAVNAAGLCGFFDWRMPTRNELMSISDLSKSKTPPTANLDYFPHMQAAEYWTGFDYGTQHESAWTWNFLYGHDRVDWKKSAKFVRLVRGTPKNLRSVKD